MLSRTYGFESDLLGRGLISAGTLDSRKSRMLPYLLPATGRPRTEIVKAFDTEDEEAERSVWLEPQI